MDSFYHGPGPYLPHFGEFELSGPMAVMAVIVEYTVQVWEICEICEICEIGEIVAARQRGLDNYILGITNGRKPIETCDDIAEEEEAALGNMGSKVSCLQH